YRLATARRLREQVADPLDAHIPTGSPTPARCPEGQLQVRGIRRLEQCTGRGGQLRAVEIATAQGRQHVLRIRELQLLGQFFMADIERTDAPQLALQAGAPGMDVLFPVLGLEPVAYLGPGPRGAQVAQVRIEPVTTGR